MPGMMREFDTAQKRERVSVNGSPPAHAASRGEILNDIRTRGFFQNDQIRIAGLDYGSNRLLTAGAAQPDVVAEDAETHDSAMLPYNVR